MGIYLHEWSCAADVAMDFGISESDLAGSGEIMLASYDRQDYDGSAFVLLRRAGVLYEVNASHCSCMGLEDQWNPEPTTAADLVFRVDNGRLGTGYGGGAFAEDLRGILAGLAAGTESTDG